MNPKVEEGDCRYMARELLNDDFSALDKVDIFALGLTLLEAATGVDLPRNGTLWHEIRDGRIPNIPNFSMDFNDLLRQMIHVDPKQRPSALDILNHQILSTVAENVRKRDKDRGQLSKELELAKLENQRLGQQLEQAHCYIQQITNFPKISPISQSKNGITFFVSASSEASPAFSLLKPKSDESVLMDSPSPPPTPTNPTPRHNPYNTRSNQCSNGSKVCNSAKNGFSISNRITNCIPRSQPRFVGKKAPRSLSMV